MSRNTRSQRRGTTLSINSLVSSSEQGKDSMASNVDEDTNGSILEAGGHNIVTGHEAPVTLKLGRKHIFPQDLPKFNDTEDGWDKFSCEFIYLIKLVLEFDLSAALSGGVRPGPNELTEEMDSYIYHCLCRAINVKSYSLICRHMNKGYDAFVFLNKSWSGSINAKTTQIVNAQANLTFHDGEDMMEYTGKLSRLAKDGVRYGCGEQPNEYGTFPIMIARSISNLPPRFEYWSGNQLSFWQSKQGTYPSIDEYIDLLLEQERILSRKKAKYTPKSGNQFQSVSHMQVTNMDQQKPKLSKNQTRKLKAKMRNQLVNNDQNFDQQQTSSVNAVQLTQGQGRGYFRGRGNRMGGTTRGRESQGRGGGINSGRTRGSRSLGRGRGQYNNNNTSTAADRTKVTCVRCRSKDGSHTSDTCPSQSYCSQHKNWSHDTTECWGVSNRR